jgi:uncharacterized protein YkwD
MVGPETRAKLAEVTKPTAPPVVVTPPAAAVATTTPRTGFAVEQKPAYNLSLIARLVQDEVNRVRDEAGLDRLTWSDELAAVARRHSADQSEDNETTTHPEKPCQYPMIRHEGFTFGASVGERLRSSDVPFRFAGENIVAFPTSDQSVYRYRGEEGPVRCPRIEEFELSEFEQDEQEQALEAEISHRAELLEDVPTVTWINREWLRSQEIAEKSAELWEGSEGHRRNMLRESFNKGGVGIDEVNNYIVITHVFTN